MAEQSQARKDDSDAQMAVKRPRGVLSLDETIDHLEHNRAVVGQSAYWWLIVLRQRCLQLMAEEDYLRKKHGET